MTEMTLPFLDEELAGWQYPFASLARAGARLAMGSDWPVSTPDPIAALHVAVNRVDPDEPGEPVPARRRRWASSRRGRRTPAARRT